MAQQSAFERILNKHRVELKSLERKSEDWFAATLRDMTKSGITNKRPETLMRGDQDRKSSRIMPGKMYLWIYDPKHKETLPYYDVFPIGFPFKEVKGGFLSLNLHYLPYQFRATLFTRLMDFRKQKRTDPEAKLKYSWDLINSASRYSLAKPCIKMYLYNHVRSPFKAIDPVDWQTAMLLPVEQFQKQSALQVWADSIQKAGK